MTFSERVSEVTFDWKFVWALAMVFLTLLKCWLALQHGELFSSVGIGLVSIPDLTRAIWTTADNARSSMRHSDKATHVRKQSWFVSMSAPVAVDPVSGCGQNLSCFDLLFLESICCGPASLPTLVKDISFAGNAGQLEIVRDILRLPEEDFGF